MGCWMAFPLSPMKTFTLICLVVRCLNFVLARSSLALTLDLTLTDSLTQSQISLTDLTDLTDSDSD